MVSRDFRRRFYQVDQKHLKGNLKYAIASCKTFCDVFFGSPDFLSSN